MSFDIVGKVRVQISLYESYCQSEREKYFSRTLRRLIEVTQNLYDENKVLRAENARLCKRPAKPKIKPSEIATKDKEYKSNRIKRTVARNPNKKSIAPQEIIKLKVDNPPANARFKGYQSFTVQDIIIQPICKQFKRERWQLESGKMLVASLPKEYQSQHFGPRLRQYALYQYYHQRVTQPQLLNQLREWGISISSGQLSHLLNKNKEQWHQEKDDLLNKALKDSSYIQVDDTGAKYKNKRYYCTQIGNDSFSFFKTHPKKNRVNFLSILQGKQSGYSLNVHALDYLREQQSSLNWVNERVIKKANAESIGYYSNPDDWHNFLTTSYMSESYYRPFTEAAMFGYLLETQRLNSELIILSDAAGQFNLKRNIACWVHAERILTAVIPDSEKTEKAKDKKLKQFWRLYAYIKKKRHRASKLDFIEKRSVWLFKEICEPLEGKSKLNKPLKQLATLGQRLLLALKHPNIPMHNNQSESDIREYVIRRNLSCSSQSVDGMQCIDTFLSLKKTAQRHQVSFWEFLGDRIFEERKIPSLCTYIK